MKLPRIIYGFFIIPLLSVFIISCKNDDDLFPKASPKNISELAAENPDLSALFSALERVNLDSVLATSTTFTVLAPKNDAFVDLDLAAMSDDDLRNFLLNHVKTSVTADFASTITTGYSRTLGVGPDGTNLSVFSNVTADAIRFNDAGSVVNNMKDIGGTNGVIHVVDGVLAPPTVMDHIAANPNFSSLNAALNRAELVDDLQADGLFTIFAPDNAAFEKFLMDVNGAFGWSTIEDIPVETLSQVLLSHVVAGENVLASDADGTDQTTLQGATLGIAGAVISDPTYTDATINLVDVQGINGVVHGIDKVILPEQVFQSVLSATLNMLERLEDRGFSSFIAALEKAELATSVATENFTAFVPNNDAFAALFATIENYNSLDEFDTPEEIVILQQLLQYHLHAGTLLASELVDGETIATVFGDEITIDLQGDEPRLRPSIQEAIPSTIVATNVGATNGVIHEINRVLVPMSLASALGIDTGGSLGLQPVGDPDLVFFDWNGKDPWWGNVAVENDAALSLDGGSYGRANFQTGGTGWQDLFWRNGGTLNGGDVVGANLNDYSLKFDINIIEPIAEGRFRIRFRDGDGVDAFYDWAPWLDSGEPFDTDGGWITVEIPLALLGQPDFSLVDEEFGMAFQDADILLNFAIDNVRFDEPGSSGPDPVADENLVFFDWNGKDPWWGNVGIENDAAISLDGGAYGRANFQTGGTGWQDLFWRNGGTLNGGDVVAANLNDYVLKFDINVFEPIADGMFRIRFRDGDGVDAFYNWAPWNDTGEPYSTDGWTTVSIPVSLLGQPDFSLVDEEFGMAFEGADLLLNFAVDNVRFEPL